MQKMIAYVLLVLFLLTSCTPAISEQPVITFTPTSTTVQAPVITSAANPIVLTPANTTAPAPVINPATNPMIITSNATTTIQVLPTTTIPTSPSPRTTPPQTEEPAVAKAMVQVWSINSSVNISRKMQSFGIVVGDGSQVLTYFDYESYTLESIEIVTRNQTTYGVSLQAIDPRTGVTLLKLNGPGRLPAITLNDTGVPQVGQQVRVWGWDGANFGSSNITVLSDSLATPRPLFFNTFYDVGPRFENGSRFVDYPGAVVTDNAGNVLGFDTTFRNGGLTFFLGPIGKVPPIASVISGIELLSPDAANRTWADGPALSAVANSSGFRGYFGGMLSTSSNYEKMTQAVRGLIGTLGNATVTSDLNFTPVSWYRSLNSTILVLVYPKPIDLKSSDGKLLAQAKWIAIEWGRPNGQPNRLVYGSAPYVIQGGFILEGNVTSLQQSTYVP